MKEGGTLMKKVGLLVMSHGSPTNEEDIERYYTSIRSGRVPTPEMVDSLKEKYKKIGGITPLMKITETQGIALVKMLNEMQKSFEFVLYLGYKHAEPSIQDAVKRMEADGITGAVGIATAPHYSVMSIKDYQNRALSVAGNVSIKMVDSWYNDVNFIKYWANEITAKNSVTEGQAAVIFTAHSLPERIRKMNDPYEEQVAESARKIIFESDVIDYSVGWQSAASTQESWIGPDVAEVISVLSKMGKFKSVIIAPIGFVSDHLEILFDNDIECKEICDHVGLNYFRTEMPNDNEIFISAMANAVMRELE